jgi:hypothetical protein
MSRWYRAYEGTVTDAKLAEVAMVVGCSRSVVIATWHALLENAATVNDGGRIDIPSRRIAAVLYEPFDTIEGVMLGFETVGILIASEIVAWKRRQYESDNSTERVRKHRASKRNGEETFHNVEATPPETETETKNSEAKASSLPRKRDQAHPFPCPAGVQQQHWDDFLLIRKRKGCVRTLSAYMGILGKLSEYQTSEWPPGRLVQRSAENNWAKIIDPNEHNQDHRNGRPRLLPETTAGRGARALQLLEPPDAFQARTG